MLICFFWCLVSFPSLVLAASFESTSASFLLIDRKAPVAVYQTLLHWRMIPFPLLDPPAPLLLVWLVRWNVDYIYKAATSSSKGHMSGTDVAPGVPSAGVSTTPNVLQDICQRTMITKTCQQLNVAHELHVPDVLLEVALMWPPIGPSGMNSATKRAHTTKNDPKTKGGPGTD